MASIGLTASPVFATIKIVNPHERSYMSTLPVFLDDDLSRVDMIRRRELEKRRMLIDTIPDEEATALIAQREKMDNEIQQRVFQERPALYQRAVEMQQEENKKQAKDELIETKRAQTGLPASQIQSLSPHLKGYVKVLLKGKPIDAIRIVDKTAYVRPRCFHYQENVRILNLFRVKGYTVEYSNQLCK